jgi:hypothetical protein
MWLLNTKSLELKNFAGIATPPYAILSHTWGDEEVSFVEIFKKKGSALGKAGYVKVKACCERACEQNLEYVWIDTCCIDKRSSAELSEAINSMFEWYKNSKVCYAYLADVSMDQSELPRYNHSLSESRWFRRGWTLQELIAPFFVEFLGQDWVKIGAKDVSRPTENIQFLAKLSQITSIDRDILLGRANIRDIPVARKMAWAASRQTTRPEDIAYCLLGLFGIHIPILYGEGERAAFQRLQLEIIRLSSDHTIFAWRSSRESSGFLAQSPRDYDLSSSVIIFKDYTSETPYSMTNQGLSIRLFKEKKGDDIIAWLDCALEVNGKQKRIGLLLKHITLYWQAGKQTLHCYRKHCDRFWLEDIKSEDVDFDDIEDIESERVECQDIDLFVKEDMLLDIYIAGRG